MKYFIDFDRTLFDTDALITYMTEQEDTKDIYLLSDVGIIKQELARRTEAGTLTFAPGELSHFVYSDSVSFLRSHEVIVVTSGFVSFQRLKVENALAGLNQEVWYTERASKGDYLKGRIDKVDGVFIDDRPSELESVLLHCPWLSVVEMRRDGAAGDGRYPVVHSLSELETVVLK